MILTTPEKLRSRRRKLYVKAKAEPAIKVSSLIGTHAFPRYGRVRGVRCDPTTSGPSWPTAVCFEVKPVGKPDAGNPHVRFDERGEETE